MTDGHCFISYSAADGLDFATKLADELQGRHPFIKVWFDKREMDASIVDWDDQLANAIKACKCLVFVMTPDSVAKGSTCKEEWTWALKYKKPVICLVKDKKAEVPFRLNNRQYIDIFINDFDSGIAQLRTAIGRLDEPEGILEELDRRLSQAKRDFQRTPHEEEKPRIQAEIEELNKQIEVQQKIVTNPKKAEEQTQKNIEAGLERERQPEKPVAGKTSTRFINNPPFIAPTYYQDRLIETKQIAEFLKNDSQRLITIVGRSGVGKTAMVCRLLKALERGELPDDLGEMKVDGIVYLSETGSHRVNFANVFADLSKLLPKDDAERLERIYKNPQTSTGDKMRALLDAFPSGRVILLLDNFETLVDPESLSLRDSELSDALNALLGGQHHAVKAVITTRIAPRDLAVSEPGRQHHLSLDEGLESPYAENVLREMDADGRVGLKSAPDALLNKAREKTRGYPRALEALYAILSVDRYTTLEELLEISLPDEVVQKLVGEAFNRLDPSAQKVMQALAVYNRPVSPAAIDYLLQPHLPSIDSALVLNRLVNMHFARREAGRYYLHPADKEYAFSLIEHREQRVENSESSETPTTNLESLVTNHLPFTQHDLLNRAADYFVQARKPRAEWKKLDDLTAQLAEFDLRCEAGDYDTACSVLRSIDFDYLLLWGHYRLMIQMHEKVTGKINDKFLRMGNLNGLGLAYQNLGNARKSIAYFEEGIPLAQDAKNRQAEGALLSNLAGSYTLLGDLVNAIEFFEQALAIAREIGNHEDEGARLSNLGLTHSELGNASNAIEYYEQALIIARKDGYQHIEAINLGYLASSYSTLGQIDKAIEFEEESLVILKKIGDKDAEGASLSSLGSYFVALDDYKKARKYFEESLEIARQTGYRYGEGFRLLNLAGVEIEFKNYKKAIELALQGVKIGDEISRPQLQSNSYSELGLANLLLEDFTSARKFIEQARKHDDPTNNYNVTCLLGIIALRQGEWETAQEAFTKSIAQADEILAKTPDYYSALDAKGLAMCGSALCRSRLQRDTGDAEESSRLKRDLQDAIETFRKARKIAPHAGVVKSVLRLFDELVKCDGGEILKDVRKAVEGSK